MAYCVINFKTKKALKDALAEGRKLTCYNPGLGRDLTHYTGEVTLEGPHFPEPHKWYATAILDDGFIIQVK